MVHMASSGDQTPTLLWLFFGFRGRIARKSYALSIVFLLILQSAITYQGAQYRFTDFEWNVIVMLLLVVTTAFFWSILALAAKRFHDLDFSGWFAMIILVPTLNWIVLLALIFIPSKQVTNKHGPPPFPK